MIKTEKQLREFLGLSETELINTNRGSLDIFGVEKDKVTYGFLIDGSTLTESVEEFLNHFPPSFTNKGK